MSILGDSVIHNTDLKFDLRLSHKDHKSYLAINFFYLIF